MTRICDRCDDWVNDLLDGTDPPAEVLDHLAGCPTCRDLYDSADRLRHGLTLMPAPTPPAGLTDRVVAGVLTDRRRRQARRRTIARVAALAAAVLVAWLLRELSQRSTFQPTPVPDPVVQAPEEKLPSLRESVARAGSAVADLTSRKVDEALESTRLLWPVLDGSSLPPMELTSPLEPTARPLQTASQGMTAGLEPVAGQARRAFALFVRDLKPGS